MKLTLNNQHRFRPFGPDARHARQPAMRQARSAADLATAMIGLLKDGQPADHLNLTSAGFTPAEIVRLSDDARAIVAKREPGLAASIQGGGA